MVKTEGKEKKLYYVMLRGLDKQATDDNGKPLVIYTDTPWKLQLQYYAKPVEKENVNFLLNLMNEQHKNKE